MWRSRKFLTVVADAIFALITLTLTTFLAPDKTGFALAIVGIIQPVVITCIAMWGVEDAAAKKSGNWPTVR
jgi:Gpi18-like mannosyltransferase